MVDKKLSLEQGAEKRSYTYPFNMDIFKKQSFIVIKVDNENGNSYNFIIDTASSNCHIDKNFAEKMIDKEAIVPSKATTTVGTGKGIAISEKTIQFFQMGNIASEVEFLLIPPIPIMIEDKDEVIVGVLGSNFLEGFKCMIDYDHHVVWNQDADTSANMAYQKFIPFDADIFKNVHVPAIKIDLLGTSYNLIVDTGSNESLIDSGFVENIGIVKAYDKGVTTEIDRNTVVTGKIQFPIKAGNVDMVLPFTMMNLENLLKRINDKDKHEKVIGVIGNDLMQYFGWVIDYNNLRICHAEENRDSSHLKKIHIRENHPDNLHIMNIVNSYDFVPVSDNSDHSVRMDPSNTLNYICTMSIADFVAEKKMRTLSVFHGEVKGKYYFRYAEKIGIVEDIKCKDKDFQCFIYGGKIGAVAVGYPDQPLENLVVSLVRIDDMELWVLHERNVLLRLSSRKDFNDQIVAPEDANEKGGYQQKLNIAKANIKKK